MRWPFVTRRERLRREAADWIARLNGPDAGGERNEFDRWYAASPDHARTYDRLSGQFRTAARARRPDVAGVEPAMAGRAGSRPLGYAFAAAIACAAILAFVLLSGRAVAPLPEPGQQFASFSAAEAGSRRIVLRDGSAILLSPHSSLKVALGARERRLRLVGGEARFTVAREARPFIVDADGAEVVAHGTEFVVRVAEGRTIVSLIEGRVDVSYLASPKDRGKRRVARLSPGERLVVETGRTSTAGASAKAPFVAALPRPASPEPRLRPSAPTMLQFDNMRLDDAIEQANRPGGGQIRLATPALASLRVSGAFRAGDTSGFAQSVAAAFGLELEHGVDGDLWLHGRRAKSAGGQKINGG